MGTEDKGASDAATDGQAHQEADKETLANSRTDFTANTKANFTTDSPANSPANLATHVQAHGHPNARLNAIDEASNGVTYFADLAALNPSLLLCECLVVTIICTLAYIGVQVRKKGLTMWYACVREAGVRVPYLMAYPVMALSSYTLYLLFLTSRENDVAIRACLGLLAFGMFSLGVVWLHVGYRYTKQVAPSETFHSLTIDWKEHSRLFWIVRVLGNAFRGIFVGLITRPTPLQASLFMVVNTSYLLIIVYVRPYKYARTNQIAILGAVLCLANTTLLVIFATSPQPFSDSTMDELGKLQIGLTVLSFVFLLLVVMSQCFHRWREARNRNDQQGKADDLEGNMRSPSDSNKRMAADKMQTSFMDASSPPQSVRTRGRTSSTVVVGDKEEEDNGSDSEACRNSDSDVDDATAHDHAGSFGGVDAQGKVEEDVNHEDPDLSSSFVAAGTPSMAVVTPSLANEDEVKTHAQTSLTQR
ncbi:Hypothetical Protein FCC1311_098702 [Hondaea fermentalgiana]|uniref:TRP C-terminal domain-containing protein n=1 Tax=Hondaea fermentalgiana TaxID=2315210 RepID=A0A2R5GRY8_9STRA|nr:Hypothetical Protein FCC1311_098702 [Hondaea fermentalgiana]|eukprot:GBG33647.1 Hypothetical Protein FCC1311_098702 [Hondaea fermentalgiana]